MLMANSPTDSKLHKKLQNGTVELRESMCFFYFLKKKRFLLRYSVALINFDKCTMILHTHHPPTSAIIMRGVQPMALIITYQFLIWESPLRHMPAAFSKFIRFQDT